MYSWKNIRTACAILLLVPIVHVTYLMSGEVLASLDASPEVWTPELDAYIKLDRATELPKDPIVVVGGRRVKLWSGLDDLLAPRAVLVRGLGDATVTDITHHYERLIGYYQPHSLVLLPSNSEFHIRDNKSAEELVAAIRKLTKLDAAHGITRQIYVFSPLKTPLHPRDDNKIDRTTQLLNTWADTEDRVTIIDANPLLSSKNGSARAGFFRNDGVNLNDEGYLRLSFLLRQQVAVDNPATRDVNNNR